MSVAVCVSLLALLSSVHGVVIVYRAEIPHAIMTEYRDAPARFGPDLPPDGLRGFLVAGVPSDGCADMEKPPETDNFTGRWIVLVARYNCSFEIKVRNAQAAGYDCVIVHNVNSSDIENMSAKNQTGIDIPSVFVSDIAGSELAEAYLYTDGYYIMVNGDLPFNINTHLLLPFAIVVLLCLLVILVFMIVKCIKDRNRARRHRLSNRALDKIPTCKFSKGDPYETCAICLDDYQEGEKLRVLPCAHAYHSSCIDPWLTQNKRVCPVCKRKVFAAGERPRRLDTDSDSDTEPLLPAQPHPHSGGGGTFEEQRENPFRRAARFMSRLHAANNAQASSLRPGGDDLGTEINEENPASADRQALIRGSASLHPISERRAPRLPRRNPRRARSADTRRRAPHSPSPTPSSPLPRSGAHSINGNPRGEGAAASPAAPLPHSVDGHAQGEIGVAALPAPRLSPDTHHIDL